MRGPLIVATVNSSLRIVRFHIKCHNRIKSFERSAHMSKYYRSCNLFVPLFYGP